MFKWTTEQILTKLVPGAMTEAKNADYNGYEPARKIVKSVADARYSGGIRVHLEGVPAAVAVERLDPDRTVPPTAPAVPRSVVTQEAEYHASWLKGLASVTSELPPSERIAINRHVDELVAAVCKSTTERLKAEVDARVSAALTRQREALRPQIEREFRDTFLKERKEYLDEYGTRFANLKISFQRAADEFLERVHELRAERDWRKPR